ncbi:WD40 repeat domain-containing protein [Actinocatenispora sera]
MVRAGRVIGRSRAPWHPTLEARLVNLPSIHRRARVWASAAALGAAALLGSVLIPAGAAQAAPAPHSAPGTLVSTNPDDRTPNARDGETRAFARLGSTVYVGGTFSQIRAAGASAWTSRAYLFAYDADTGAISTTFLPQLNGAVNALVASPDGKLIVGGAFNTVNGVSRKQLVELDPSTGATVTGWDAHSDGGVVRTLALHDNQLYVGGAFHWLNGTQHSLLGRMNATTGQIDPSFQVDASVPRSGSEYVWTMAVSPDGNTLVVGGNFTQVNGQARNQLAMIDLTGTPQLADWSTQRFVDPCYSGSFDSYVTGVDFSDDGSYFVVSANGGRGSTGDCDSVSRWETGTRGSGIEHTWVDRTGTDSVTSILAVDGVIYAAGHFRWVNNANGNDAAGDGAVDRLGIAALDPVNGLPLNWNPRRSAGSSLPSGATAWGSNVPVLWRGPDGVYFGQNSDGMGNEYHGRLGMFPTAGGRATSTDNGPTGDTGYLYLGAGDGALTRVPYDAGTLGTPTSTSQPNLVGARAAFSVGNKLYWARSGAANQLQFSTFNGTVGAPWTNGYDDWFQAANMNGAFLLDGRMYYTVSNADTLYYRYLEPDSYVVGCTYLSVPTTGVAWSKVRGMTYVDGNIVYGYTDGTLRSVPFDPTAATTVDGSAATTVATAGGGLTWSNQTLFFATR